MLHQDARVYAALPADSEAVNYPLAAHCRAYVRVAGRSVVANGQAPGRGDAVRIEGESALRIADGKEAAILLFELP